MRVRRITREELKQLDADVAKLKRLGDEHYVISFQHLAKLLLEIRLLEKQLSDATVQEAE